MALGAFYPTKTKKVKFRAKIKLIKEAKKITKIPIVAIGGININNIDLVLEAGADSICVISAVSLSDDPEKSTKSLVDKIQNFSN